MLTRKTEFLDVDVIQVGPRARPVDRKAVDALAASIEKIGLRTPITVRMMDADAVSEPMLVSGLHRLEACKALGLAQIECFVVDHEDDDRARMWEIAENLYRCELNSLERSEHIAEWVRLSEQVFHGETGTRAAARNLNLAPATVHRAIKIDNLSDEAKDAAKEIGMQNATRALVAAAALPKEQQAGAIREIAESRASRIDRDVKDRAANEVAQIICEHVPGEWWDALKANLYAAGAANIANALTNIVGQSIMDRRHGHV